MRRSQTKSSNQEYKENKNEQLDSNNLGESFSHAIEGIIESIISERNLRVHFLIGLIVLSTTLFLPVPREDLLWLVFAVFFVIWSELINTMVEYMMNLYTQEYHPIVRIIKDVSAGVVLWAALFSVTVGIVVFGGLLFDWSLEVAKIFAIISTVVFPVFSIKRAVGNWKRKQ